MVTETFLIGAFALFGKIEAVGGRIINDGRRNRIIFINGYTDGKMRNAVSKVAQTVYRRNDITIARTQLFRLGNQCVIRVNFA